MRANIVAALFALNFIVCDGASGWTQVGCADEEKSFATPEYHYADTLEAMGTWARSRGYSYFAVSGEETQLYIRHGHGFNSMTNLIPVAQCNSTYGDWTNRNKIGFQGWAVYQYLSDPTPTAPTAPTPMPTVTPTTKRPTQRPTASGEAKYKVLDRCDLVDVPDSVKGVNELARVSCCTMDGAKGTRTDAQGNCSGEINFAAAKAFCATVGHRLCTEAEVGQSCYNGCGYNFFPVWTLTPEGGDPTDGLPVSAGLQSPTPPPTVLDNGAQFDKGTAKLRLASYNVFRSSVFPKTIASEGIPKQRLEQFARIAKAVNADIWAFQETLYGTGPHSKATAKQIADYMKTITGKTWYYGGDFGTENSGEFLLSRFPITWATQAGGRAWASLIDLSSIGKSKLLLVDVHFMSHGHATETNAWLKKVFAGQISQVPKDTMTVVCGDFNGGYQTERWNSINNAHAQLSDVKPKQLHSGYYETIGAAKRTSTTTDKWTFGGNRIDFVFVKPVSGMAVSNAYVLNTFTMARSVLNSKNIKRTDCSLDPCSESSSKSCGTDHLPIIVDFGGPIQPGRLVVGEQDFAEPFETDPYDQEAMDVNPGEREPGPPCNEASECEAGWDCDTLATECVPMKTSGALMIGPVLSSLLFPLLLSVPWV